MGTQCPAIFLLWQWIHNQCLLGSSRGCGRKRSRASLAGDHRKIHGHSWLSMLGVEGATDISRDGVPDRIALHGPWGGKYPEYLREKSNMDRVHWRRTGQRKPKWVPKAHAPSGKARVIMGVANSDLLWEGTGRGCCVADEEVVDEDGILYSSSDVSHSLGIDFPICLLQVQGAGPFLSPPPVRWCALGLYLDIVFCRMRRHRVISQSRLWEQICWSGSFVPEPRLQF